MHPPRRQIVAGRIGTDGVMGLFPDSFLLKKMPLGLDLVGDDLTADATFGAGRTVLVYIELVWFFSLRL